MQMAMDKPLAYIISVALLRHRSSFFRMTAHRSQGGR
jgi:hypothetical protein